MKWKAFEEPWPEIGQWIWVMTKPHKHRGNTLSESARSIEIKCGEFVRNDDGQPFVENCDELGGGWEYWAIWDYDYEGDIHDQDLIAWMPVEEMPLPDFYSGPEYWKPKKTVDDQLKR